MTGSSAETIYTFLTLTNGSRAGSHHILAADHDIRIGRGLDCDVVLTDPLSSRVHAVIHCEDGMWYIRDANSRNGTFVDGKRSGEAVLNDGTIIRIGAAEYAFHQSTTPPADTELQQQQVTQQIIRKTHVAGPESTDAILEIFDDPRRVHDFLSLYQLSLKLLRSDQPDELLRLSMELLLSRTDASVVGFLWPSDNGQLIPKLVIPDNAADKLLLSQSLTELVIRKGHAVWIANAGGDRPGDSLAHYADAICVPLSQNDITSGVLHLYREQGRFEQDDYDIALSVGTMLAPALVRARKQSVLAVNHSRLVAKSVSFDDLIGESPPMKELKTRIERVARATGCVLVRGESGSGKELVARAIHQAGPRSDRPMLAVNCAAIPRELMESQLFGHKKGAFTGADSSHIGWFQQADTGTLFLDEVGELTLEGQAKLLRILEDHPFSPVGSTEQVQVDVRVIAATNRDLSDFVQQQKFREDLYYRLTVFELYVPPLRERGSDIERLLDYFLNHFKLQHGRPQLHLEPDARKRLIEYGWPGNVRQLRNVIDSAVVMAIDDSIEVSDLGLRDVGALDPTTLRIDAWEKKLIDQALTRSSGSVPDAAKMLGISRATLYRKIEEYGISR